MEKEIEKEKIKSFLKTLSIDLYEVLDIKIDIEDMLEGVNEDSVSYKKIENWEVFIVKTKYGYFWKSGKMVSDIFESAYKAYKDAKGALL